MHLKKLCQVVTGVIAIVTLFACSDAAQQASDPNTPRGAQALSGDESVIVSWNKVDGASSYDVCWAYVDIKNCDDTNPRVIIIRDVGVLNDATNRVTWIHNNITNATSYKYVIVANGVEWGSSPISVNVNGFPQDIEPPKVVSISANGLVPTISWEAVSGATGYNLYMDGAINVATDESISNTGLWMNHPISSGQLSFRHAALIEGKEYSFVVTAERDIGDGIIMESEISQEVRIIPRAIRAGEELYMPNDFSVSSGYSELSNGEIIERFDVNFTNPCQTTSSNNYAVNWTTGEFTTTPICIWDETAGVAGEYIDCKGDASPNGTNQVLGLAPGVQYYFTVVETHTSLCGDNTRISAQTTDFSSVIGMKTPGATLPVQPIISVVPTLNKLHSLTIDVSNADTQGNHTYNLYMAANNAHCDSQNPKLTVNNYKDDAVWGMVHNNIPLPFTHAALPSTIPFCFIVTSVNEAGVESVASNEVIIEPL